MIVKFTFCQIPLYSHILHACEKTVHFYHLHPKITAGLDKLATPYTQYPLRARPQEEADWYNSTHIRA